MSRTKRDSSQANIESAMLMIRKPYGEAPTDIDLPATAHAQVVATVAVAQALMDVADAIRSLAPATAQPAHGPLPRA